MYGSFEKIIILYDSCPSNLRSQCSAGNLGSIGAMGKLGKLPNKVVDCMCVGGLLGGNNTCMHVKNGSAHCCGCVVNGSFATTAC